MSRQYIIDFHSHILPKMDDGSKSLKMSRQMLDEMGRTGTRLVFATSHFYGHKESAERYLNRRARAWGELSQHMEPHYPEVRLGAEVAFFSGLERLESKYLDQLCMEGTKTLLLEMPFDTWSGYEVDAVSELTLDRGYKVLMAHFERFFGYGTSEDIWKHLLQLPIQLQMNAGTLLPWLSRKKWLAYFEDEENIPVLGSDAHNMDKRAPNLAAGRAVLEKKLGRRVLSQVDRRSMQVLGMQ